MFINLKHVGITWPVHQEISGFNGPHSSVNQRKTAAQYLKPEQVEGRRVQGGLERLAV
ncbi:hypothetical protein D3C80_1760960 [compost metagenome]